MKVLKISTVVTVFSLLSFSEVVKASPQQISCVDLLTQDFLMGISKQKWVEAIKERLPPGEYSGVTKTKRNAVVKVEYGDDGENASVSILIDGRIRGQFDLDGKRPLRERRLLTEVGLPIVLSEDTLRVSYQLPGWQEKIRLIELLNIVDPKTGAPKMEIRIVAAGRGGASDFNIMIDRPVVQEKKKAEVAQKLSESEAKAMLEEMSKKVTTVNGSEPEIGGFRENRFTPENIRDRMAEDLSDRGSTFETYQDFAKVIEKLEKYLKDSDMLASHQEALDLLKKLQAGGAIRAIAGRELVSGSENYYGLPFLLHVYTIGNQRLKILWNFGD